METSKYQYNEDFEPAIDYWIFCKQYENVQEARDILLDEILLDDGDIPGPILIDRFKALQKLNSLSDKEYYYIKHILDDYFFEESQIEFRNYQNYTTKLAKRHE